MNVSNDSPTVNYVDYFTKQFPKDLAEMATLRDELAKRQGALSAVEESLKDREAAAQELAKAKVQADDLVAEAKADAAAAKAKLATATAKEKDVDAKAAEVTTELDNRAKVVAKQEADAAAKLEKLDKRQADLDSRQAELAAQEEALQARVKAFQDKVAAISA